MRTIGYIGNSHLLADIICCAPRFSLQWLIAERGRVTEELLTFSTVREVALHPVSTSADVASVLDAKGETELVVMGDFGIVLNGDAIDRGNIYNIHCGDLPRYKGRHPTFWATVNGEKQIGISLHKVVTSVDAGEIISNRKVPYYLWMNEHDLQAQLTRSVPELLEDLDRYLEGGKKVAYANAPGHYHPRVKEADYHIDLARDAPATIYNKVRAQAKYRGASCDVPNVGKLWIKKMRFCPSQTEDTNTRDGSLLIEYRDGLSIRLLEYSRDEPAQ